MSRSRVWLVSVALLTSACADEPSPVGPVESTPLLMNAADALAGTLPGVAFITPLGGPPTGADRFDDSLADLLSVEVCLWQGGQCQLPLEARITASDPMPARLRVGDGPFYVARWDTDRDRLRNGSIYRVRVLAGGQELASTDVRLIGPDQHLDPRPGIHDVRRGELLPIRFWVAQGLGGQAGPGATTLKLAGGGVKLDVPAGALAQPVFITAIPATQLPPSPPVVPGSAWDFGPDGLAFQQPVLMTLSYDPALLPAGSDENELRIHKLENGVYTQLNAGVVDVASNTVSAPVNGFSVYVILPRLSPGSPDDLEAPQVQSIEVRDPTTGQFGNSAVIDPNTSDVTLVTRFHLTDNITGVEAIQLNYEGPSGGQVRFLCLQYAAFPPIAGSDTNGTWECSSTWPRYTEAGTWRPTLLFLRDKISNGVTYFPQAGGLCGFPGGQCLGTLPTITVNSNPSDLEQPTLHSFEVSLDIQPRGYGSSVLVDASTTWRPIVFGFRATDNLAGVGLAQHDLFVIDIRGPSGHYRPGLTCQLAQGDPLDGFWECPYTMPQGAETGTWRIVRLYVPDRAGNGTHHLAAGVFTPDGSGRLCNPQGNCVAEATVEVVSAGDSDAPRLQSLNIVANSADVTTTMDITDDNTGTIQVVALYRSATSNQFNYCFGARTAGTPLAGTYACTITFSQFAARGQWLLQVEVWDGAGNYRLYYRRASDGFLCYLDPALGETCQSFGDTDLVLQ